MMFNPLLSWYVLAQVHKVDIRYFDHAFQPAPNNKYKYSAGGVRAEAGTLHIGHDFEDTTRANIFIEGKERFILTLTPAHALITLTNNILCCTISCRNSMQL